MTRRKILIGLLLALLCAIPAFVLLSAIHYRDVVPLIGGYHYWYGDDGVVIQLLPDKQRLKKIIAKEEREFGYHRGIPRVGPEVKTYRVYKNIITGYVTRPAGLFDRNTTCETWCSHVTGYFIIDVDNDQVHNGLDKKTWLRKLHHYGIKSEPQLFKPSVFDSYNGHTKPL